MYFAGEFKHHPLVTTILSSISVKIVQIGNLSTNSNLHRMQTETSSCKIFKDLRILNGYRSILYPDNSRPPIDRRIERPMHINEKIEELIGWAPFIKKSWFLQSAQDYLFLSEMQSSDHNHYVKAHWEWLLQVWLKNDQEIPAKFYGLWDDDHLRSYVLWFTWYIRLFCSKPRPSCNK